MKKLIVISLLLAALLTGCGGRELSEVTLIQTIAVDGPGPVTLTALGDEEEPAVYEIRGEDVTRAQEGLKGLGTTRLEVTHVSQLVLGPDVDVAQVLWQELTHRKSGYGATVWLAGTPAGELLAGAEQPCRRLKALEENGGVAAPTLLDALSALTREGEVSLPVLAREGEELRAVGMKTVKEG